MKNKEEIQTYFNCGLEQYNKQNYKQAIEYFDKIIEQNVNNAQTYYLKGISLSRLCRYDEAILNYNKAIEYEHDLEFIGTYYFSRGCSYKWQKEYDKALSDFEKSLELENGSLVSNIILNIGLVKYDLGLFDEALNYCLKSKSINPDDEDIDNYIQMCKDKVEEHNLQNTH